MDVGKIVICFVLLAYLPCFMCEDNEVDCGDVNHSYLDVAMEMIKKAKDTKLRSPKVRAEALDCADLLKNGYNVSGVYNVFPKSRVLNGESVKVYCDMETDGGGWTVIQRRGNFLRPIDYFYQDWNAYKYGFGFVEEDFWLGNDNIFALSNQKKYSLRFDMKDVEGNDRYALYDTFWIDDEDHKYTLHIDGYSGDAGDSMTSGHNDQKFSTKDQDNDENENQHCAQIYKGGWWYKSCHAANLNGLYLRGAHKSFADSVIWFTWKGHFESLETTEIKIRPKGFRPQSIQTLKTIYHRTL